MVVSTSVELARVLGCLECGRLVQKLSANRFGVLVAPQYPYADIISRVILPPSSEDPPVFFSPLTNCISYEFPVYVNPLDLSFCHLEAIRLSYL